MRPKAGRGPRRAGWRVMKWVFGHSSGRGPPPSKNFLPRTHCEWPPPHRPSPLQPSVPCLPPRRPLRTVLRDGHWPLEAEAVTGLTVGASWCPLPTEQGREHLGQGECVRTGSPCECTLRAFVSTWPWPWPCEPPGLRVAECPASGLLFRVVLVIAQTSSLTGCVWQRQRTLRRWRRGR